MSITATTLTGAVGVNDLTIGVAAVTGAAIKNVIQIDNEFMVQTADAGGLSIPVRRGDQGTYNQVHTGGAVVIMGLASDFPAAPPGTAVPIPVSPAWTTITLVASGALVVPTTKQNVYVRLMGPTTNAYTLAVPTYAQDGQELLIQAEAAHAYTLQGPLDPALVFNGTDLDHAAFGGAIGDNIHLKAVGTTWMVVDSVNVSLSDTD